MRSLGLYKISLLAALMTTTACGIINQKSTFSGKITESKLINKKEQIQMNFSPWITGHNQIKISLREGEHASKNDVTVHNHHGHQIHYKSFHKNGNDIYLDFKDHLYLQDNFKVTVKGEQKFAIYTNKALDNLFHYTGDLGPTYDGENLSITIWSPTATAIEVLFFKPDDKEKVLLKKNMTLFGARVQFTSWVLKKA